MLHSRSLGAIVALGLLLMAIFLVWLAVAQAIYVANFGYAAPASIRAFVDGVLFTPAGWTLIIVGTGVGFLFAVVVLTISAVSFPLLLDRDVGAAVALATSVRAVIANPVTMAAWGLDRRRAAGDRLAAVLSRPDGGAARARPLDLAPLSRARRTRPGSAADVPAGAEALPLGGGFSGRAVPVAAGLTAS